MTTDEVLVELQRVNDAATPGQRRVAETEAARPRSRRRFAVKADDEVIVAGVFGVGPIVARNPRGSTYPSNDAAHIARFDPPTVRALLACAVALKQLVTVLPHLPALRLIDVCANDDLAAAFGINPWAVNEGLGEADDDVDVNTSGIGDSARDALAALTKRGGGDDDGIEVEG